MEDFRTLCWFPASATIDKWAGGNDELEREGSRREAGGYRRQRAADGSHRRPRHGIPRLADRARPARHGRKPVPKHRQRDTPGFPNRAASRQANQRKGRCRPPAREGGPSRQAQRDGPHRRDTSRRGPAFPRESRAPRLRPSARRPRALARGQDPRRPPPRLRRALPAPVRLRRPRGSRGLASLFGRGRGGIEPLQSRARGRRAPPPAPRQREPRLRALPLPLRRGCPRGTRLRPSRVLRRGDRRSRREHGLHAEIRARRPGPLHHAP